MTILYAIRRKSDHKLMPNRDDHKSRIEFGDYGPPRLYTTVGGAKTSLRLWCLGYWGVEKAFEATNEYGDGFYYQGLPVPLGKGQRNPDDYEIVSVQLFVRSL
jgi:hypothetical protein